MSDAPIKENLYAPRLNRVLDHISDHLAEDLSLGRLADVACFSSFHFHRIFKGQIGETVNAFVRRQRLERAAQLLRASPRRTLTDVAFRVGFASSIDSSRIFKAHFGFAPSRRDRKSPMPESKIRKAPGEWPATRFTYFRLLDAYEHTAWFRTYDRLFELVADHALDTADLVVVGMSPDDPEITPREKYRYDLGLVGARGANLAFLGELARERGVAWTRPNSPTLQPWTSRPIGRQIGASAREPCRLAPSRHFDAKATS